MQLFRYAVGLSVALSLTTLATAEDLGPLQGEKARRYLAPIEAYEELFTRCRMTYREGVGGDQEAKVVRSGVEAERVVDGPREFFRSTLYDIGGRRNGTEIAVTDGTTQRRLRREDGGTTLIVELSAEADVSCCTPFTRHVLQPSQGWGFANAEHLELLGEDGDTVRLRFHREHAYMDADYARYGDYLRITRFQSGSKSELASVAGTEYRYHYTPEAEGDRQLAPAKIEQISKLHGVHGVLEVLEVDLNPAIPDGQFELDIPEGATVIDRTADGA